MSEKIYNVPAEWAGRAFLNNEKYLSLYKRSVDDPNLFWGEQGKRIDWIKPYTKVKNTSYDPHNVSIKWYEDGTLNVCANCIDRHLKKRADQIAIIWEGDDPTARREDHLPPALRAGVQVRQRAEGQRRQEGRPRHHLPADDPRGRLRHPGLRPHRRHPFRGVRRLLAGQPGGPHRRCRLQVHHHGRRGRARRPADPAQEEHRRGAQEVQGRREGAGGAPHRRAQSPGRRAATSGCTRNWSRSTRVPAGGDGRRGPAVHPLHLGLDRQAEGRAAHDAAAISSTRR